MLKRTCRRMIWWQVRYYLINKINRELIGGSRTYAINKVEHGLTRGIFIHKGHREMISYLINEPDGPDENDEADDGISPNDPHAKELRRGSKKVLYDMELHVN